MKQTEEVKDVNFNDWLDSLEDKPQPEVCSIENEDCEACGS